MRARDDLSRHARAADDDPAAQTYVDTRRRKISVWPVDTESELADRVRPVRRRTLKAPGIALDLHDRVVGARDDTVESRAHGPAIDDGGDVEVAVDRDMQEASIDGRSDAPGEAAPHAREHRSGNHVAADPRAELPVEIGRRKAETSRAGYSERAREGGARGNDVAGAHELTNLRTLSHSDGQRVVGAPALATPGHVDLRSSAAACSAVCHRATAGMRSPSRSGSRSGRPRASMRIPSSPDRP